MSEHPYHAGDTVRFTGSTWQGTIIAALPDFEASGETGYAVSMSDESKKLGALPIETVSSKLIEPIPTRPYTLEQVRTLAAQLQAHIDTLATQTHALTRIVQEADDSRSVRGWQRVALDYLSGMHYRLDVASKLFPELQQALQSKPVSEKE